MFSPESTNRPAYVNGSLKALANQHLQVCGNAKGQNRHNRGVIVRKTVVYALGGNALKPPTGDANDANEVLARVMSDVIDLLEMDWSVVITHGNGPQVGHLMALDDANTHTLSEWVAATQGMIGHQLSMHLQAILERRKRPERTAVVLTHVEVNRKDEAFEWPTKPVGPVLDATTVMSADWDIAETIQGPRRVVASPLPERILELDVIRHLVALRAVVFCGGGGGIPTSVGEHHLQGVPAVVDKDHFSSLLAAGLEADALIISTEADAIYQAFGTPDAEVVRSLSTTEAKAMEEAGEFPPGSMGPKVKALCQFVSTIGSSKAVLCSPGHVLDALRGEQGTTITL
tara:strand:- start:281 stop:1312 length:1032 start_codon:yes stop_codon:yes gene_type:complete